MEDIRYVQPPPQLVAIGERTTELQFSMASEPMVGALLRTLVASKPGGRFLELGTGTGVATAWLLQGMDERSTLISVDNDGSVQAVARASLGGDSRLTFVTAEALDFLRAERAEGFDLVFADAMLASTKALSALWPSSDQVVSMSLTTCCHNRTGPWAMKKRCRC